LPFLLNSDDFVFDSQIIAQTVAFGFKIAEIAVPTRYFKEASSVNFRRSVVYGLATLSTLVAYLLDRTKIRPSPLFNKTLPQIISRYHRKRLLRLTSTDDVEPASPYPITLES
jgi:hypothetical protein